MKINQSELKKRSKAVCKFLKKRELISKRGLAKKVGYDPGNFWRLINGEVIMKQSVLFKVEKKLRLYGFN